VSAHHPHPLRRSEAPAAGTGVGEGRPATVPTSPRRAPWTRPSDRLVTALALGAWALVIVVARMWGDAINRSGRVIRLHAPPLVGWDDLDLTGLVVLPLAAGVVAVAVLPRWAARLPWRRLLVVAAGAAALWGLALALTAGWEGVTRPLILKNDEYLLNVADVGSPGPFLDRFTEDIDRYVNHVRSHPPGMLLALWTFDWIGLGGTGWAAVLCVGGGVAAVPAVLLATRDLAGERAAGRLRSWPSPPRPSGS
jgi:methylthioxylose transferase